MQKKISKSLIVNRVLGHSTDFGNRIAFGKINYSKLGRLICGLSAQITGPRVLIACSQRHDSYIGMLAALHAGATYAPLNVDAPIDRQNQVISQFDPTDIIQGSNQAMRWHDAIRVGAEAALFPQKATAAPAYVIFTSGSTGDPKGVVISRRAMDHFVAWAVEALEITPNSRISQHPNVAFDLSVMDIFSGLYAGAQIFPIQSSVDKLFPGRLILREQLSHWISVPSVIDLMAKDKELGLDNFKTLNKMVFCGEPLLPRHLRFIFEHNRTVSVLNTYGPTEATVCMTKLELLTDNWQIKVRGSAPLGDAIPGMKIELEGGQDANQGEIVLSGRQIAEGYWRSPDLTDKVFKNGRYYTGDWGEIIHGELYFKSRIDRQIKIHGHRIELGDIEDTISKFISGAVACVEIDNVVIAFLEENSRQISEVKSFIDEKLPVYMRPRKIFTLLRLPRSLNDKVDYKVLTKTAKGELRNE